MSQATWYIGDAMKVLATLPDASVDLVMTSPPFLALRSYLPADHEDKALEIGAEATPGAFLDVLLDVTEELARVLAPHGSLVVELGDTYAGGGADGGDAQRERSGAGSNWQADPDATRYKRGGIVSERVKKGDGYPLAKSLCMIPSSFAWALAYGRNPWTGRTTPPWRVRNLVAWCRPNPPVGALGDKMRPATSYLTVACKSASRYFDLDAVREPHTVPNAGPLRGRAAQPKGMNSDAGSVWEPGERMNLNPAGAPPLDWWEIPTHPYPGSHYATFPPQLCVRPIKAMCPQRVCRVCGKPSERITEPEQGLPPADHRDDDIRGNNKPSRFADPADRFRRVETLGWSDCGHDDWRPGVVLDCFAGSGTTLEVATGHGRDAIGIDLDPRNLELARQRIGMFLTEAEVA